MATLSERSPAYKALRPFAMGATAACAATCCVQPIDMVKVRIQVGEGASGASTNPVKVAKQIIAEDGFMSLYRGLSAGLLRQLTYGMTRLGIFRTLTNRYKPDDGSPLPMSQRVVFSLIAGGTGALVGTPADAALVRMQTDSTLPVAERRGYKNAIDALVRMGREEGIRGFFSGASPTVIRGLSINVGMLSSYDPIKNWMKPKLGDNKVTHFGAGFLSGWTAATVSLPFDFVKTRLQKQKIDPATGKMPYSSFMDCVTKTLKEEGPLRFYRGYGTYVFRITPHIMLTWVFLEGLNGIGILK